MNEQDKSAWRKTLNKIQDFVADPDTKRYAKAGGAFLNVASQIGQANLRGPFSIAGAAVGVLDVVANHASPQTIYGTVSAHCMKNKLRPINSGGAVALLYEHGFFMNADVVCSNEHYSFVSAPLGEGMINVVLDKGGGLAPWWSAFISENLSTTLMSEVLWDDFGEAIVLTFRKDENEREALSAAPIPNFESNEFIGDNDPTKFIAKYRQYRKAGLQRAYLAVGPPGTGKTTFCFRCARLLGGKLMMITPDLLENQKIPHQEIVELVGTFQPAVLLFEDVDRVSKDGLLLSLMDFMRQQSPDTLMISTANDPEKIVPALKRPGRLGPRITFKAPDLDWRRKVLELYSAKLHVTRDLTHFAEMMEHPEFTHDYIREVCEQALVENDETITQYIMETVRDMSAEGTSKKDDSKSGE